MKATLIYIWSITQPVLFQNVIFRHLQNRTRVSVWLYEATGLKIEGIVVGFDEFMNICLDEAQEVVIKKGQVEKRKEIGNQIFTVIWTNFSQAVIVIDRVKVNLHTNNFSCRSHYTEGGQRHPNSAYSWTFDGSWDCPMRAIMW